MSQAFRFPSSIAGLIALGFVGTAMTARAADYSYTDVAAAVAASTGSTLAASRVVSVNASGTVLGFYQASGNNTRVYFTLGTGGVVPYASYNGAATTYFSAANNAGTVLNNNGSYLASTAFGGAGTGGYVGGGTFTPVPTVNTYNGTFANTLLNGGAGGTQTRSATSVLPYAINNSGVIVGIQNYTADNAYSGLTHGYAYNPSTNTALDIGGNAAGANVATGFSALSGVSDNNYVVGNAQNTAANFRGSLTNAILGRPDSAGAYGFTDLSALISPLASAAGGVYAGSNATDISPNGRYVVGTYTATIAGSAFTRSFRILTG